MSRPGSGVSATTPGVAPTARGDSPSGAGVPRRTQAERRADTEQRVLEATMGIIARDGVQAVTAASVGLASGYSRGIVNHQFGTREALLKVVAETVQARFAPGPDIQRGREYVRSLVARYLASVQDEPQEIQVFLRLMTAALSGEEPSLHDVFVQRDAHFRDHIAAALADGQHEGTVRADLDPVATAALIVGQLRGVALQLQLDPAFLRLDALVDAAVGFVDRGLKPAV
jgi:AcrR family transcriptional regulator